jgi:Tfp pilus assembly protein PilF
MFPGLEHQPPIETPRPAGRDRLIVFYLIALTAAVYTPALHNGFVNFDDDEYVADNPIVKQGLSPAGLAYAWSTFKLGNWIPLTWMSYELDVQTFGPGPFGFHLSNLALHVANVLLLFLLLRRMTGASGRSAVVAAVFAVHPLHVESVAWIAERKDVLSTSWLLLALLAYERYARRPGRLWYAALLLAFLLGLLAKAMLVTLPVLLLLLDYWPLERWQGQSRDAAAERYPQQSPQRLLTEKLPLLAVSLVCGLVAVQAQRAEGAVVGMNLVSFPFRLANAVQSCAWYVWKTIAPTSLCAYYPLRNSSTDWPALALSGALLLALSAWAARNFRNRPEAAFGWLWFLISLLPVIGIVQVGMQSHADRYAYVPHIGLLTLLVWTAAAGLSSLPHQRLLKGVLAATAILLLSVMCLMQTRYWHDPRALWNRALQIDEANWFAHYQLGREALRAQQLDEARRQFERTVELSPKFAVNHVLLGAVFQLQHEPRRAEECFRRALSLDPDEHKALFSLASLLESQRRFAEAEESLRHALQARPRDPFLRNQFGLLLLKQGQARPALQQFLAAIDVNPGDAPCRRHAGAALAQLGETPAAIRQLEAALQLDPAHVRTHILLATLYESQGRTSEALRHCNAAASLGPGDEQTLQKLAALQERLQQPPPPQPPTR